MTDDEAERPKAALDRNVGLRFHDQGRLRSHLVTRAFSSAIRASAEGAQSEVLAPDEVTLLESDE